MRVLFAAAVLTLGIAGLGEAGAADAPIGRAAAVVHYPAAGVRAPMRLIYDNEPGVYVRAYWAAPWRNRHYYPFTGKRPKVGRHERLSATRPAPKPAQDFYREWSTVSLYPPARPARYVPAPAVEPPAEYFGPLK